jgi:hypothetical protein
MPVMDSAAIADLKRQVGDRRAAFAAVATEIAREVAEIAAIGSAAVPEIEFAAIARRAVPSALPDLVRRRGCVVVRGTFPPAQAAAWDAEIAAYLARNDADALTRARRPGRWGEGPPQIYSVYWSRPQVLARQSQELAALRSWLNRLWRWEGHFGPDRDCTYADRIRRRGPGDVSLALGPHIDGGTAGRWLDAAGHRPYRAVLCGDPSHFDPFDAAFRPEAAGDDANGCSVFRTWQGWTALTAQGPGDGTLMVLPVARAIVWVLLRPFLPDVPEGSLCGAESAKALFLSKEWHAPLLRGLVPIPRVAAGDTVWWHPDLIHAVEARHGGTHPSNVMYIGAAPDCPRNRAYLAPQLAAFRAGRSPPDFPPDDLEVAFAGRAGPEALSDLGRRQMGLR